jgi:hypothetical protein
MELRNFPLDTKMPLEKVTINSGSGVKPFPEYIEAKQAKIAKRLSYFF